MFLLNAATIYMDVLRDSGNVEIQQSNVTALKAGFGTDEQAV